MDLLKFIGNWQFYEVLGEMDYGGYFGNFLVCLDLRKSSGIFRN